MASLLSAFTLKNDILTYSVSNPSSSELYVWHSDKSYINNIDTVVLIISDEQGRAFQAHDGVSAVTGKNLKLLFYKMINICL